jgi:hypothetical protein
MSGIHREIVKRILRGDLNVPKTNFNWVPHGLNSSHKAVRVQVSRKLLDFLESRADRSLLNAYTGDEM